MASAIGADPVFKSPARGVRIAHLGLETTPIHQKENRCSQFVFPLSRDIIRIRQPINSTATTAPANLTMTEAATATGKTPRSIAAMFAPTTDITQFTDFIFRNDTTDEQRNDTINDRTLIKQFGFIGEDGRLDVISFPRNSTDGATATVVASLGDNPDHPQPVKFLRSVFRGYTVTVLPQEAVTLGHLPTSISKPSETAGPDPADGSVVRRAGCY
jgi:hypothetical protein